MATERVIDLEHRRYADREYEGELPPSTATAEEYQRILREAALARLRGRALPGSDLWDLLLVLGLDA